MTDKQNDKKGFLIFIISIAVFALAMVVRIIYIEVNKKQDVNTFFKIYAENGRPVNVINLEFKENTFYKNISFSMSKDGNSKHIYAWLDSKTKQNVKKGQKFIVSHNGKEHNGIINSVSNQLDYDKGLYMVKAQILDDVEMKDKWISAKVVMQVKKSFALPSNNVYCNEDESNCYIWIVENNKSVKEEVEKGISDTENTEILFINKTVMATVITSDDRKLKENEFVKPILKNNKGK